MPLHRIVVVFALLFAVFTAACEKTDHDTIDKWMNTEAGPGKLRGALADGSIDPDLSAHAAQNLLLIGEESKVLEAFEKMSPERRGKVLPKLAPRLWKLASIDGELTAPSPQQMSAKDLLFGLRTHADDATRTTIDGYLIEWFTGGYYEGRAEFGRHGGAAVMRAIGRGAGARMRDAANAVVGAPVDKKGKRLKIGDQLLLGLAVTGEPEAIKYVLDILAMDRGDPTLAARAISALFKAYVKPPSDRFPTADPEGLVPNLPTIAAIAQDPDRSNTMVNDAVALLAAVGMPHCLDTLLEMIRLPRDERYLWMSAENALRCGRVAAIDDVAGALPQDRKYEHESFAGSVVNEISRMTPRDQVVTAARALLEHQSWVARWIGIEVLAKLASAEDAARIEALKGDTARLSGYWGDQRDLPKKDRKPEPTLGKRAIELAKQLSGGT